MWGATRSARSDRRDLPYRAGCTEYQPRRPLLRPFLEPKLRQNSFKPKTCFLPFPFPSPLPAPLGMAQGGSRLDSKLSLRERVKTLLQIEGICPTNINLNSMLAFCYIRRLTSDLLWRQQFCCAVGHAFVAMSLRARVLEARARSNFLAEQCLEILGFLFLSFSVLGPVYKVKGHLWLRVPQLASYWNVRPSLGWRGEACV